LLREHRSPTYTLVAACLQQRQPLSSTDGAAIRRPCVLCRCTPCVESVADRTETQAVVDNNIQESSKDISVQLSTLLPLTIECAIGLTVGGALQMQLLLLLLQVRPHNVSNKVSNNIYMKHIPSLAIKSASITGQFKSANI